MALILILKINTLTMQWIGCHNQHLGGTLLLEKSIVFVIALIHFQHMTITLRGRHFLSFGLIGSFIKKTREQESNVSCTKDIQILYRN